MSVNPARGIKRPADQRRDVRLSLEQYALLGEALAQAEVKRENITAFSQSGCLR